jgi:hypothetical protein
VPKKRTLKDVFNAMPDSVQLDTHHDMGWRFKSRRKKLEKQEIETYGAVHKPVMCMPVMLQWSEKGRGFGEYVFWQKDGIIYCRNECDSRDAVKRVLCRMVDQAVFEEDAGFKKGTTWPPEVQKANRIARAKSWRSGKRNENPQERPEVYGRGVQAP